MSNPAGSPYRAARRAFVAACEAAGVDAIARVQPGRAPDGKPLFMDAASLGPRDAQRGALVVACDAAGSAVLTGLLAAPLEGGVRPAKDARLVLVHAFDPARFAGQGDDQEGDGDGNQVWALTMLGAVAAEDLARTRMVSVLMLTREDKAEAVRNALAAQLPSAQVTAGHLAPDMELTRRALAAFL